MRNKIVKELSEKYPLSRDDIGELYDLVVKKYKLFPDLSIPEQCEIIIKNSIQHATCIMIEYHNHMFEAKNTPEQITQDILEGMRGIGGMPTNEEFYAEFDFRLRNTLGLNKKEETPKRTPEQIIIETFDKEVYKMLDFPSDNEMEAIICAIEIYANQNKKP